MKKKLVDEIAQRAHNLKREYCEQRNGYKVESDEGLLIKAQMLKESCERLIKELEVGK